jgi:hypothetical protein
MTEIIELTYSGTVLGHVKSHSMIVYSCVSRLFLYTNYRIRPKYQYVSKYHAAFFPPSSSSTSLSSTRHLLTRFVCQISFTVLTDCLMIVYPRHTPSTININASVMKKYSQTHPDTMGPVVRGSKFQNDALKSVATNVPGRKTRVIAVMTRISAA